jgi:hypothetical protein
MRRLTFRRESRRKTPCRSQPRFLKTANGGETGAWSGWTTAVAEVAIFSGPNARERAIRYADGQYGNFEEISLAPYP